jgi:hypothetical protein
MNHGAWSLNHNSIPFGEVDIRSENRIPLSPLTQGIKNKFILLNTYKLYCQSDHLLIPICI